MLRASCETAAESGRQNALAAPRIQREGITISTEAKATRLTQTASQRNRVRRRVGGGAAAPVGARPSATLWVVIIGSSVPDFDNLPQFVRGYVQLVLCDVILAAIDARV